MEPLGDARAYVERGKARQQQGDLQGAIADFDEALKLNPQEAEAYRLRALARYENGDAGGAVADQVSAMQLAPQPVPADAGTEPHDAASYIRRACQRQLQNDLAGAVADCAEALKRDPQSVEAYLVRARARQRQGYLERAVADCERALQINPAAGPAYLLRGALRGALDQLDLARQDYDKVLEIDPQNAEAFTLRAQIRAAQGDPQGAIADCGRALEIDRQFADAYLTRAAARWERGELGGALADCDEAIRLEPNDARAYLLRGNVRQAQEDDAGARSDYQHAVRLDPGVAEVLPGREDEADSSADGLAPATPGEEDADAVLEAPGTLEVPTAGGLRSWLVPATMHGLLAGAFYGWISSPFAVGLALFLFAPLLLGLFLGRSLGLRRAALAGTLLACGVIVLSLVTDHGLGSRLLALTDGTPQGVVGWLLAWGVFGALLFISSGGSSVSLMVGLIRSGLPTVFSWMRVGTVSGLALGAVLGGLYWVNLPGGLIGATLGAACGLLLGLATGWSLVGLGLAIVGAGLGTAAGDLELEAVYEVIGAGVAGGIYWTVAGAFVAGSNGFSVGARAGQRLVRGALPGRLFGGPLPDMKGFNLATALLAGMTGLFTGANVGLLAGSILAGLAVADRVAGPLPLEGVAAWIGGAVILGLLLAGLLAAGIRPKVGSRARQVVPLVCLLPLAFGLLALVAWQFGPQLGGVAYWACAGAAVGGVIGIRLWSTLEQGFPDRDSPLLAVRAGRD
jgi:tetratricopeptide (TPR) repeat protein